MNRDEKELVFKALAEIRKSNPDLIRDGTGREVDEKLGEIQSEKYSEEEG